MLAFIDGSEHEIIRVGIQYLHIEGAFYCGIGILFLWYGYYRAVGRPEMSVVLTVISLGTRVLLSYTLAPIKSIGENTPFRDPNLQKLSKKLSKLSNNRKETLAHVLKVMIQPYHHLICLNHYFYH